jgi:FkbM family methyltransferase
LSVKDLVVWATFPFVYALNRPIFYPVNKRIFDVALRGMGIATAFPGRSGLTYPEERFISRIRRFLDGKVVLDVGANIGHYACAVRAVAPGARVYAFEPHPIMFPKLQARAGPKGFEAIPMAMSDRTGMARLHDFADISPALASTQASLSLDAVDFFGRGARGFDVQCSTIDTFLAERNLTRIGLLKVDTEGFDINVLRGATEALRGGKIDIVQFELIPASVICRVFMKDFFDLLVDFSIHRLCMNGRLIRLDSYETKYCEIFSMSIFVAVRKGLLIAQ